MMCRGCARLLLIGVQRTMTAERACRKKAAHSFKVAIGGKEWRESPRPSAEEEVKLAGLPSPWSGSASSC